MNPQASIPPQPLPPALNVGKSDPPTLHIMVVSHSMVARCKCEELKLGGCNK